MTHPESGTFPSPASTQSAATTTTASTPKNYHQQQHDCEVYWDDHQQHNRIIHRVKQPHSNSKRNSALAGIPSPSKPASDRGEPKQEIEGLHLHEQNHKALRYNKRRKSRPQTDAEHHEPNPPLASTSAPQPPLLPKQKAWQELATRLSTRRKRESSSSSSNLPEPTSHALDSPQTRPTTPGTPKSNLSELKLHNGSNQNPARRVSASSSSIATPHAPHLARPPAANPSHPRAFTSNQSSLPPKIASKSRKPATGPLPNDLTANNTYSTKPVTNHPNCDSLRPPRAHSLGKSKAEDRPCAAIPEEEETRTEQERRAPTREEKAGEACDPWEVEEDDEFGSQLLELADLVEKEQRMSQELAAQQPSKIHCTTASVTPQPAPWKLVEHKKKTPASLLGPGKAAPTPATRPLPLMPAKSSNIVTIPHNKNLNPPQAAAAAAAAAPNGLSKQSAIIYKTGMVSKAGIATTKLNTVPSKAVGARSGAIGGGNTGPPRLAEAAATGRKSGVRVLYQPPGGATTTKPTDAAPLLARTPSHQTAAQQTRSSYSDALLRKSSAVRVLPQNPLLLPVAPPARKPPPTVVVPPHTQNLDLDSLFSGIDGSDLDWDPDDQ